MDIVIAGAGISGLAAAIALRRQGHRITLFEQSRLNQETGAAIFLPPNANGLMRKHGFFAEDHGGNLCLGTYHFSPHGELLKKEEFSETEYPNPWHMLHRQQLHAGLKALALDPSQPGFPAKVVTSKRVVEVDADRGALVFDDGSQVEGHVVLGADGMRSKARAAVQRSLGTSAAPFPSGKNAFRFMIPRATLLADPETKAMFSNLNTLIVWFAEDIRLVCYPCDDNTNMNFVAIHPATRTDASGRDWNSGASKQLLESIYQDFGAPVRATVAHADPASVNLYPLMDMDPLLGWTSGRLALIGDAAHPFLPHQGQGGAQAIEDAMSLAVFLPAESKASEVPERLRLYELARKERAHKVQQATRITGYDLSILKTSGFDREAMREYTFRYDEIENSKQVLSAHWQSAHMKPESGAGVAH